MPEEELTHVGIADAQEAADTETVALVVDGTEYRVAPDQTILQALDAIGVLMKAVEIPHYCWHPKLAVDGSCRMCQVEIVLPGAAEETRRLDIACATPVEDGLRVHTKGDRVQAARSGVMELLLLNHPLDCPICDQAGECGLQDHAVNHGRNDSRSREPRRTGDKRVDLGPEILLDRERCILCRRCVRFCREVTGSGELAVLGRADHSVIDCFPGSRLDNPYSMNTADICPVGALTTKDFRFKMRVWYLDPVDGICGGCARGCNIHQDVTRGEVQRFRPRRNDAVNDTWMCDAGRLSYHDIVRPDRLTRAQARDASGALVPVALDDAIEAAARRLRALVDAKGAGVVAGVASPHASNEDLFVLQRLLTSLGTENRVVAVVEGEEDDLLLHREKAANAAGARAMGYGDASVLADRIRGGGVDGIVILGHDLLAAGHLAGAGDLAHLDTVIVIDSCQSALQRAAHWLLPASVLAEKNGTLVNCDGRVQRQRRAVPPPPGAFDEGEILQRLARALGLPGFEGAYKVEEVSRGLGHAFPAFAGLDLESLPETGAPLGDALSHSLSHPPSHAPGVPPTEGRD